VEPQMIQRRSDEPMHRTAGAIGDVSLADSLQMAATLFRHLRWITLDHPVESIATIVGALILLIGLGTTEAAVAIAWWLLVVVVVRSDLAHFLIPDWASLGIALLGLANAVMMVAIAYRSTQEMLFAVAIASLRGLCAATLLWMVGRAFQLLAGREGLGFGDVKLAGASAIWLGPLEQTIALQFAAIAAMVLVLLGRRANACGTAIPFGAFLAPAAWLVHVASAFSSDLPGGAP
jgi:leader peptidase (prepilin peptidase)/N-methyltransferase